MWAWRAERVETFHKSRQGCLVSSGASHQRLCVYPVVYACTQGEKDSLGANVSPEGVVSVLSQLCTEGKGSQVRVVPRRNIYQSGASRLGTPADKLSRSTQQWLFLHPGVNTSARHARVSAPTDAVHGSGTCDRG